MTRVGDLPTTAGALAVGNLHAQIDGRARAAAAGRLTVRASAALIDLVLLRGHVLGRIVDHEWAEALAEQLVQDAPGDAEALLARARTRATSHRFPDALADLDAAQRLGADPGLVDGGRAAVFQATGRYEEAGAIFRVAVEHRADLAAFGDLATSLAERGEVAAAENAFREARERHRGVSPIPLAQLDLARARLWISAGDLGRARSWLDAAVSRLPAYAPAAGQLAEVEAALGETDSAISRLLLLTRSSDDPDHGAQLARILGGAGRRAEAHLWRDRVAARYDDLVARHPEAFADHAAEFWLGPGADPRRALWLATRNHEVRPTARALELLTRARLANDVGAGHAAAPELGVA